MNLSKFDKKMWQEDFLSYFFVKLICLYYSCMITAHVFGTEFLKLGRQKRT